MRQARRTGDASAPGQPRKTLSAACERVSPVRALRNFSPCGSPIEGSQRSRMDDRLALVLHSGSLTN